MEGAKILYITYDGLTDNLGQSQILPYLSGLADKGHHIHILSCEKRDNYDRNHPSIQELLEKKDIQWDFIFYSKTPPVLSTLYDIWRMKLKAQKLQNENQFQITHCRSYLPALIGFYLKKKYKIGFVFDMRGFWADERVEGNLWNLKNPVFKFVYNYFKKKEKAFVHNADAIISLTKAGKEEISSWTKSDKLRDKIYVIPCCVDTDLFDPSKKHDETLRKKLGINQDDLIISYLGSLGTYYLLDEMLTFFVHFKKQYTNAKFLFVSPTHCHADIASVVMSKSIKERDVIIVESPRPLVADHLSLSDFSIFFYKKGYSKLGMSPTKQGELMAMGIPVLCSKGIGDTESIIQTYQSGVLIDEFSQTSMLKASEEMMSNKFDPTKIRNGALDFYSLNKGVKNYDDIYSRIVKSKKSISGRV